MHDTFMVYTSLYILLYYLYWIYIHFHIYHIVDVKVVSKTAEYFGLQSTCMKRVPRVARADALGPQVVGERMAISGCVLGRGLGRWI